ncbi:carboxypeptidase-like regulatory domain-containing protein [Flavobacteriaceae bacterium M23B6Z8]
MRSIIIFLICLHAIMGALYSQSISGYVYDKTTREPILGVNVYFEGTTLGTVSNEEGYFEIEVDKGISKPLIVSYVGYAKRILKNPFEDDLSRLYLVPEAMILREVIVGSDPFSRRQKLKAFEREFLGKTIAGRSCTIRNTNVLKLRFDSASNTLKAYADEPLVVQNDYLGYIVKFEIINFEVLFSRKSLSPTATVETRFSGFTFYADVSNGNDTYLDRRKKVYEGSSLHFMRATASQSWIEEDFELYELDGENNKLIINPAKYIQVTEDGTYKKVSIKNPFWFSFKNKKKSGIKSRVPYFRIDPYGNHMPAEEVKFEGWIAAQRAGDLLPNNYGL